MRTGTDRIYLFLVFVESIILTGVIITANPLLVIALFVTVAGGILLFHGREARIKGDKLILEWGLIIRRRREIPLGEITDIIDANSARYFVLVRYFPEFLFVPLGMLIGGVLLYLFTEYPGIGLVWILMGILEAISYLYSQAERRKAALIAAVSTLVIGILAYFVEWRISVPLIVMGLVIAGMLWENGPMLANTIIIVTWKGTYSLVLSSREEMKNLTGVIGSGEA